MAEPKKQFKPGEHPNIGAFIDDQIIDANNDPNAPPFDSVREYEYEGGGSTAGSLSSIASSTNSGGSDLEFGYLMKYGPKFGRLADMYGVGDELDEETDGAVMRGGGAMLLASSSQGSMNQAGGDSSNVTMTTSLSYGTSQQPPPQSGSNRTSSTYSNEAVNRAFESDDYQHRQTSTVTTTSYVASQPPMSEGMADGMSRESPQSDERSRQVAMVSYGGSDQGTRDEMAVYRDGTVNEAFEPDGDENQAGYNGYHDEGLAYGNQHPQEYVNGVGNQSPPSHSGGAYEYPETTYDNPTYGKSTKKKKTTTTTTTFVTYGNQLPPFDNMDQNTSPTAMISYQGDEMTNGYHQPGGVVTYRSSQEVTTGHSDESQNYNNHNSYRGDNHKVTFARTSLYDHESMS